MGFVLSKPDTNKKLRGQDCPPYVVYGSASMQGWRVSMEDAHTTIANLPHAPSPSSYFAVYDGHGGRIVSRYASRHVHIELLKSPAFASGNIKEALSQSFIATDARMLTEEGVDELQAIASTPESPTTSENPEDFLEKGLEGKPMWNQEETPTLAVSPISTDIANLVGCTAVALYVDWGKNVMYCANSGDSRCVISVKGVPEALSMDHKPDMDSEKTRIEKAGGFIRNGRVNGNLNLTRTLGDFEYKQGVGLKPGEQIISCVPDVVDHVLNEDCDFAVLGCDGIWDVLTNSACMNFIRRRLLPTTALTDEEKALDDSSRIQAAQDAAKATSEEETIDEWPGDVAESLEELLNMVAAQTMMHCLAPNIQCGIGCDNMTIVIVLFRQSTFGKRVVDEFNARLEREKASGKSKDLTHSDDMVDG